MKRLVAYVRHEKDTSTGDISSIGPRLEWVCEVEYTSGHRRSTDVPSVTRFTTFGEHALEAIEQAELCARGYGFGLTWHGFVAHGFEIEAQNAKAEGAGGA